jgi:hypothetical protein
MVFQGVLYGRKSGQPRLLSSAQVELMLNRLMDRCKVDIIVSKRGEIRFVRRPDVYKPPRESQDIIEEGPDS